MDKLSVCEVFQSIQGESTHAGLPCFFIRLAGCNLRCRYCDTPEAYADGRMTAVGELVKRCRQSAAPLVEITGGEPLLQEGTPVLASAVRDQAGKTVLIETNGSCDLSAVPGEVIAVVDVKTPGSGEPGAMDWNNVKRLREYDEVKFVLCDRTDYEWAVERVQEHDLPARCRAVHFSPAWGLLDPGELARWIVNDAPPVRLHLPLHKVADVP